MKDVNKEDINKEGGGEREGGGGVGASEKESFQNKETTMWIEEKYVIIQQNTL